MDGSLSFDELWWLPILFPFCRGKQAKRGKDEGTQLIKWGACLHPYGAPFPFPSQFWPRGFVWCSQTSLKEDKDRGKDYSCFTVKETKAD